MQCFIASEICIDISYTNGKATSLKLQRDSKHDLEVVSSNPS